MKKPFRFIAVGLVGVSSAALMPACSDDSATVAAADASLDASDASSGIDASSDINLGMDAGLDATSEVDTGQDASLDSGPDATTGAEAAPDSMSGVDATLDATVDASTSDAAIDHTAISDGGLDQSTLDSGNGDVAVDGGAICAVPDPSLLDATSVEAGFYSVWQVYKCAGCHQKKSSVVDSLGNGIVLSGNSDGIGNPVTAFPPNLTSDPETGLGCWTDIQVVDAILQGSLPDGGHLCPSMPIWGNTLATPDGGIRAGTPMDAGTAQSIVDFLRSLPVVSNAVQGTACATATDGGDAAASDTSTPDAP